MGTLSRSTPDPGWPPGHRANCLSYKIALHQGGIYEQPSSLCHCRTKGYERRGKNEWEGAKWPGSPDKPGKGWNPYKGSEVSCPGKHSGWGGRCMFCRGWGPKQHFKLRCPKAPANRAEPSTWVQLKCGFTSADVASFSSF